MDTHWAKGGCEKPEPVSVFNGQDTAAVAGALGKPMVHERFKLGEGMNEFRIELQNDFPLPANADLSVQEQTWAKDGCRLTLWSVAREGALRVIRATRWPEGLEF